MATLVYLDTVDPRKTHIKGIMFSQSQAGSTIRKTCAPCYPNTQRRNQLQTYLQNLSNYYKGMPPSWKPLWAAYGEYMGLEKPFDKGVLQLAYMAWLKIQLLKLYAGEAATYTYATPYIIAGPTISSLTRIDDYTVRAVFTPSPLSSIQRLWVRQAIPSPGYHRSTMDNAYLLPYSANAAASPQDFTLQFPHLSGWHARYFVGIQDLYSRKSLPTTFDL